MLGLETIVRGGITGNFDDVVYAYYHGPAESLAVETNPGFQRLLVLLDERGVKPSGRPNRPGLNVHPTYNDLVRNMAARIGANSNGTTGGSFHGILSLEQQRYIAAPARNIPETNESIGVELDIDLAHGISFDGASLLAAMFQEGFDVETVRNREGMPRGYRDMQIGQFFVSHAEL